MARPIPDGAPLYPGLWKGRAPVEIAREAGGGAVPRRCVSTWQAALKLGDGKVARRAADVCRGGERWRRAQTVEAHPERWGDAVIVRKDVPTSYHLAVVVDDAWQGVTHVTRGRDLYAATDLHRLLQVLLDLPEPIYRHHRLIVDETGRKLAKSARDTSLRALRERGASPRRRAPPGRAGLTGASPNSGRP